VVPIPRGPTPKIDPRAGQSAPVHILPRLGSFEGPAKPWFCIGRPWVAVAFVPAVGDERSFRWMLIEPRPRTFESGVPPATVWDVSGSADPVETAECRTPVTKGRSRPKTCRTAEVTKPRSRPLGLPNPWQNSGREPASGNAETPGTMNEVNVTGGRRRYNKRLESAKNRRKINR